MSTLIIVFSVPCASVGVFLLLFEPFGNDVILSNVGRGLVVAAIMVPIFLRYRK